MCVVENGPSTVREFRKHSFNILKVTPETMLRVGAVVGPDESFTIVGGWKKRLRANLLVKLK